MGVKSLFLTVVRFVNSNTIFREEARSAFHAGPLVEMNLEILVFVEGGKLFRGRREKTLRAR